jgi:hypothetical protein
MNPTPKKAAKELGLKRYEGRPCKRGHGVVRYVSSGDCVMCRGVKKNIAAQQKRAARGLLKPGRKRKYPIFVGPPKPKVSQKYDRSTDIGDWIYRSKHGGKRKFRRALTVEDYLQLVTTHCPLLGVELTYAAYEGTTCPTNYATLDKIDPAKGYVAGNVQILSHRANVIKNNATLEELKLIATNWENLTQSLSVL